MRVIWKNTCNKKKKKNTPFVSTRHDFVDVAINKFMVEYCGETRRCI